MKLCITLHLRGDEIHCTSEDLSKGGMYVKSREPLPEGAVVRATMVPPGGGATVIECRARVAWVNQGFSRLKLQLPQGFGVEFLYPGRATVTTIRATIDREKDNEPQAPPQSH